MNKDEALRLALEALEGFIPYLPLKDEAQCNRYDKAIIAIKEALETKDEPRTWVGLKDEELLEAWHWGGNDPHIEGAHFVTLYKYFETKLKEKNHGNS
jgi:hypothetical protein